MPRETALQEWVVHTPLEWLLIRGKAREGGGGGGEEGKEKGERKSHVYNTHLLTRPVIT
jgi:hypothetical protein